MVVFERILVLSGLMRALCNGVEVCVFIVLMTKQEGV